MRFACALFLSRNPTSKIALVGGFEVAGIVSDDPYLLCKKWQTESCVEKETFLHYFRGAVIAYGILIGRTWQFDSATELKALRRRKGGFHLSRIGMSEVKSWES